MSLQIATTFPTGLSAPDAVHKVLEAQFAAPNRINVMVGIYADLAKSQDGATPYIDRKFVTLTGYDPAVNTNMHTQVYDYLKTLPEYAGAVDV